MPTLTLTVVTVLAILALPAGLKDKSVTRFSVSFVLSFFGILLPIAFFFLSACLIPEGKDKAPHGWIDCFHLGKLAMTPFVLWATAALYAVEIYEVKDRTRPWIIQGLFAGAIVSFVCLVLGLISDGIDSLLLLAVPFYVAVWYGLRAGQFIRDGKVKASPLVITATSTLPFWTASVFWSYKTYLALPEITPPDCFVVTAASRGHQKLVGPFREVTHRGCIRLANQQLITLWEFEALWRRATPRCHALFRRGYNVIGPILARRITSPLIADLFYLVLKPAEFIGCLLLSLVALRHHFTKLQPGRSCYELRKTN